MEPRGIRNNNPGNIRHGASWKGMSNVQADKDFVTFSEMRWGIRALYRILLTYKNKYGLHTMEDIINRYAPPVENPTQAYIRNVCILTGYTRDEELDFSPDCLVQLARAIVFVENGRDGLSLVPPEDFTDALEILD